MTKSLKRTLEAFKAECKRETEDLFFEDKEKYLKWKELRNDQEILGEHYEPRNAMFHSGKKCPNCGTDLTEEVVKRTPDDVWIVYTCTVCGYEYAW